MSSTLSEDAALVEGERGSTPTAAPSAGGPPRAHSVSAGSTVGHYEVIRLLGRGGMGAVYLARDTKLGRLVALKLLLRQGAPDVRRFLDEARVTARCKHENIVVIYEVGEHEGAPYMALEYVEGPTLRAWMRRPRPPEAAPPGDAGGAPGRVPPRLAVELMAPVVRALVCAHEQGVVHRDLKPENVLLADAGHVKVVDFGIAKQLRVDVGPKGAAVGRAEYGSGRGTRLYMAPEQWRGDALDHRVDLWAVGIMLFELCAGARPVSRGSLEGPARVIDLDAPMPSLREACPGAGPLAAIVDRCLAKRKEARFDSARELLDALGALLVAPGALTADGGACPFLGLAAFQEADATRFFGRDADVASMLRTLRGWPLVSVVGASGAGKSSFVRAGVIPALKRLGERWEAFTVRPGRKPLSALDEVLAQTADAPPGGEGARPSRELAAALREQPGLLGAHLRARCRLRHGRALLFVDQFEELYTLGADDAERAAFLACLDGAADDASSPLRVVLALRSDFLDRLAEGRALVAEASRGLVVLPPPGRQALREALARPLEAVGYRFEGDGLVDRMLDALEGARGPLPLLQFAASKLWEARDVGRRLLTEASYERLGGVAGALSAHADTVLAGLSAGELRACRDVLLRLVTAHRTRAVLGLGELRAPPPGGGAGAEDVERAVQRLLDARLLSVGGGDGPEDTTVELAHESLIERWPTLRRWLDEGAHDALFLARLRAAAHQWGAGGEAEGLLWRDGAAEEARAWLARRRGRAGEGLGGREGRYLKAVVALGERARRVRRRAVTGLCAALSLIATAVSLLAVRASREAVRARNATRIAAARELQSDPTTALALVRELEPPDLPRGWATMADWALRRGVAAATFEHSNIVYSVSWSPDGRQVASASRDKLVRVWGADGGGDPLVLRGHEEPVTSVAFSPDGRRVASASADQTVRVWGADGAGPPLVLRGHEAVVSCVAWSPDGRRIVSASKDKTVRVWGADGGGDPLVLRGHEEPVTSAAFSPDGRLIATGSYDQTVRVWGADGAGPPLVLRGHKGAVFSVAFDPGGRRIASASGDGTVRLWGVDGAGDPFTFRDHKGTVWSATWGPNGQSIASASSDKTVRVFRADGGGVAQVFHGHDAEVVSVAWAPDGRSVASASYDKTVRSWRTADAMRAAASHRIKDVNDAARVAGGPQLVQGVRQYLERVRGADGAGEAPAPGGREGAADVIAASPDGRRAALSYSDGTVQIVNVDGTGDPLILRGHSGYVHAAGFSPDGLRVATGSWDHTIRVWSATGPGGAVVLRGYGKTPLSVAFSPDGRRVATGATDREARIWRADGSAAPLILRGHEDSVGSIAFSPDGRLVVTASYDGTARIWDADGGAELHVLRGHEGHVTDAAFSPDGSHVVTASLDQTVRLWRADGSGAPRTFGHDAPVYTAAFSHDGERLVSATADTAWAWAIPEPIVDTDDPRLWAATAYCLPAERRIVLLNMTEPRARDDELACRRRVDGARRLSIAPGGHAGASPEPGRPTGPFGR